MKVAAPSLLLASAALCPHHRASGFVLRSSPSAKISSASPTDRRLPPRASIRPSTKELAAAADGGAGEASATAEISKAPTLNGKVVLPVRAMTAGLKGHKVAAVYAVLDSGYKRGSGEGWEHVKHISITKDLANDISYFLSSKNDVAHIRALSFSYPQKATMEDFANGWKQKALGVGNDVGEGWGRVPPNGEVATGESEPNDVAISTEGSSTIITVGDDYEFDDEDEYMDEDDLDDYLQMMAESRAAVSSSPSAPAPLFIDNTGLSSIESLGGAVEKPSEEDVISPFDSAVNTAIEKSSTMNDGEELELNVDNVDKVLDEVRPYLISDGGNVSVQNVDSNGDVFLLLEGACGSCASSTVTMKMGIERVLKEKFGDKLGEVVQVDPEEGEEGSKPTELTMEAVQSEVDRISTAIIAMGGVVRVVGVDPIGEVEIEFRGPNRVKKGLELALLDVEYVKHVKFVS